MKNLCVFVLTSLSLAFVACDNKTETLEAESVHDYFPLQVGKYITYRLDSTVFINSGSTPAIHRYQLKNTVAGTSTDNAGNTIYLISSALNNENGNGMWQPKGVYAVTKLADRIETNENNLRVINLMNPVRSDFTWKGNSYLPVSPFKSLYDMNAWNFMYHDHTDTTINGSTYNNVWSVIQSNSVLNIPPSTPNGYGEIKVSTEKYAKGIGLIYKNFQLYEHQPGNVDTGNQPFYTGFGITLWIIDHN